MLAGYPEIMYRFPPNPAAGSAALSKFRRLPKVSLLCCKPVLAFIVLIRLVLLMLIAPSLWALCQFSTGCLGVISS